MKSLGFLLFGISFAIGALAQGTVDFRNNSQNRLTTNNQTGFLTGAGQFTIGLYIAPQGTTDPNAFTLMGPTTTNLSPGPGGSFNGRFDGNPNTGSLNFFVISNNAGQPIAFQVRAWSTFFGPTYEAATAYGGPGFGWIGSSGIGQTTPVTTEGVWPSLFGTGAGQVSGFVLTPWPVPEPSSAVLALLGAAALGLWRFGHRRR